MSFRSFMLRKVIVSLASTSVRGARNAPHRLIPWEPQLDRGQTLGWGWGQRNLKEKGGRKNGRPPSEPKESYKVLLAPFSAPDPTPSMFVIG